MKLVRAIYPVLVAVLIVLTVAVPVFAADIMIDGDFMDWADKASVVDAGGADDEGPPALTSTSFARMPRVMACTC